MQVVEAIKVPKLWERLPCLVLIPESWVTTQKAESLAWEIPKAPEPMAMVVNTFITSESNPNGPISGATMEAVVIMATVVEP